MTVVIVGTGVGGVRAAQTLRSEGYSEPIYLVGEETGDIYDRPHLSKGYLGGTIRGDQNLLLSEDEAVELDIELVRGSRATSVDFGSSELALESGQTLKYDSLIVATGVRALLPQSMALPGVHVLRTQNDADSLRSSIETGKPVVIIGAGFIGAEAAATLRRMGVDVTVVDTQPLPMQRALDERVGQWFHDYHVGHGVKFELGSGVEKILQTSDGLAVCLTNGKVLEAGAVLAGLGGTPNSEWLEEAGASISNGVLTDEWCRIEGQPQVYALGDVARWRSVRRNASVRMEHWTNAVDQAVYIAKRIAGTGGDKPYDPVPYVWTDQYDWKMQIIGHLDGEHHYVVGDPETDGKAAVIYHRPDFTISGAVILNWPKAMVHSRRGYANQASAESLRDILTL